MICQYNYIWDNVLQLFHKSKNMLKILRKLQKERPKGSLGLKVILPANGRTDKQTDGQRY